MTTGQPNPYAPPSTDSTVASTVNIDPAALRKIDAIIKDAGQFWLAILICILCSALGAIIIGPWYFVRFLQWNSMARDQPMLLDPNVPRGSVAQKFQSAKIKLLIGMVFGALMLLLFAVFAVVGFASAVAMR